MTRAPASSVRLLTGACALGAAVGWCLTSVGAVADELAADYGVSLATVGLFSTVLFVVQAASQIPVGNAIDRLGARRIGMMALGVVAASNLAALVTADPALALGTRAVMGLGVGMGFVAGASYVRATGGTVLAQGVFGGVAQGGAGLALAVVPQLLEPLGWRAPYISGAAVALLSAIPLAQAPPAPPAPAGPRPRLGELLRHRGLIRLGALHVASFSAAVVLGNWVVPLLVRDGYGTGAAGAVGAITLLFGIASRPAGGLLVRRFPGAMRPLLMASMVAGGAGTALLVVGSPLPVAVVGSVLVGIAGGIPFGTVMMGAAQMLPRTPAAAIGATNGVAVWAIVVGTPLLGLTFSLPGDGQAGFAVVAVLWALAALIVPARIDVSPVRR